jgi:DNA-binding CsgD family transcriptional regulator
VSKVADAGSAGKLVEVIGAVADSTSSSDAILDLARQVAAVGAEMGLPHIAASADIGSPDPMRGPDGKPFAGSLFTWVDPDLRYWEDRGFALRSAFVHAARAIAEPFWFDGVRLATWRPSSALEALNADGPIEAFGVAGAITAPAYLPGGVIGAVVWATSDPGVDVGAVFAARAAELHALSLRFMASYGEGKGAVASPVRLTRREIQCLKWAAAGKTDAEVAEIVAISLPTVRFHITNAARKLGVVSRSQAVHRAATLGYIGSASR